jgi:hypothetical protein
MHDSHSISLSPDLAPGEYELSVGMYDLETLLRAPATGGDGKRLPQDRIVLTSIHVQ